jgi:flagellar biosynthesis/type III secretory pathway protein FliH
MQSELSTTELLFEAIRLGKALPDNQKKSKVLALTLVMANKLVGPEIIEQIWEEVNMLEIIKYAEEKGSKKGFQKGIEKGRLEGREKGIEEGREKGMEQGIEKGKEQGKISLIKRLLEKKFGLIPVAVLEQIDSLNDKTLDALSLEILDMQRLEDLNKYINVK